MVNDDRADRHPFQTRPHRTVLVMSLPVLISLIAEPLTGLVDTAFVARLGSDELAALGAAAVFLSTFFWVFSFLGVGAHTEVAQASGANDEERVRQATAASTLLAAGIGVGVVGILWPLLPHAAEFMGARGEVYGHMLDYLRLRLVATPAVLYMFAGFGVLRGRQNMRTPLIIAAAANGLNLGLDPLLIWGAGPVPALGISGAALASTISQWLGASWVLYALSRGPGLAFGFRRDITRRLLAVGRDMTIRTGCLTLFLLLATRAATRLGPETGAAHQVVRQVWTLTALILDAFATSAQSLVGFFLGAGALDEARRAARITAVWSVASGVLLAVLMIVGEPLAVRWLVPEDARTGFAAAWLVASLAQPLGALSFATDGVHWGTGDYRYLRNGMLIATVVGVGALYVSEASSVPPLASLEPLTRIWTVTVLWLAIRAAIGVARLWPGLGHAPLFRR